MRQTDAMEEPDGFGAGRMLWQRCRTIDVTENEPERFLDLAALADGRLEDEEHNRVAALVAADPIATSDIAAAAALARSGPGTPAAREAIIRRAIALLDEPSAQRYVIPFPRRLSARHFLQGVAQWGSLAAAVVVASWLGFMMGSGVSLTLSQPGQSSQISDESFLPELLDPSTGFLRDFVGGQQT